MKHLLAALPVLLLFSCKGEEQHPPIIKSPIDALASVSDVENFITAIDTNYRSFKVEKISEFKNSHSNGKEIDFCKKTADSLGINKAFYLADFDNNGYTDLMVFGNYYDFRVLVVMGNKEKKYKMNFLSKGAFSECTFPKIREMDGVTVIDYYQRKRGDSPYNQLLKNTLIYKYGDFIEYNDAPANHSIEKIEYSTTGCFGSCPVFNLAIDKNRNASFYAEEFNTPVRYGKQVKGKFSAKIKEKDFNEMVDLLNYIDFTTLKKDYSVGWTDDQSCTLKITYDNGKTKIIDDYGLIGTYGLGRAYKMLFDLRFNQQWK